MMKSTIKIQIGMEGNMGRQNRMLFAEQTIFDLLRSEQSPVEISYDDMAARVICDRHTAIQAVRRLEQRKLVSVHRPRRGRANQYVVLSA
jgi:Mn-dependent DtxR family transcriptional regulator